MGIFKHTCIPFVFDIERHIIESSCLLIMSIFGRAAKQKAKISLGSRMRNTHLELLMRIWSYWHGICALLIVIIITSNKFFLQLLRSSKLTSHWRELFPRLMRLKATLLKLLMHIMSN